MILDESNRSSGNNEVHTDGWQGRLWRAVIRVWIAGVLGFFFVNRLLESETIRRILHGVVAH